MGRSQHDSVWDAFYKGLLIYWVVILIAVIIGWFMTPNAYASGSDSPTPYTVSVEGITLPAGVTFPDNGHVNIRAVDQNGPMIGHAHFEGKCRGPEHQNFGPECTQVDPTWGQTKQNWAQYIGKEFIPWSALGVSDYCSVGWVQLSQYNEHWGEGHQPPLCSNPTPTTPPTTPASPEPSPEPSSGPETPTPESTSTPTLPPVEPSPEPSIPTTPVQPEPQPSSSPSPTSTPTSSTPPPAPQEPVTSQKAQTPTTQTAQPELAVTGGNAWAILGAALVLIVGGALIKKGYPNKT